MRRLAPLALLAAVAARAGYRRLVAGDLVIDVGIGRSIRPLGPLTITIDAPRALVFEVIAAPYLGRQPEDVRDKVSVLERGSDMVLAAHRTPMRGGLVATTLETVRFEPPSAVHFRLTRGPVPFVRESFVLHDEGGVTRFDYEGELGTDFWQIGRWWGALVGHRWEQVVDSSMAQIRERSEERAARRHVRSR